MSNTLRLIISLIIIAVVFTLLSCEKDDIVYDHYEMVVIDPENPYIYLYADSVNPENGWVEYENGTYKYFFELEGTTAILHPTQQLRTAHYSRSTFDKNPVPLEISDKNSVKKSNVTPQGVFVLIYH